MYNLLEKSGITLLFQEIIRFMGINQFLLNVDLPIALSFLQDSRTCLLGTFTFLMIFFYLFINFAKMIEVQEKLFILM